MSEFDAFAATPGENPAAPPAAPSAAPISPAPAQAPATPGAPPTPGSGVPDGYVPSYRLREVRESAAREWQNRWQQQEQTYQSQVEQLRTQLQALVGVQPPQNPEVQNVRDQFGRLYPGLTQLEERANDLMGLIERSNDLNAQNEHYWASYGRQTMDRLYTHAQDALGTPLTEEGKRQLHTSFTGFVQSSPEMTSRYANDPTIVEDFWKQFTSTFIDPVRRSAAAGVQSRVPGALPQDSPSGAPRSTPAPGPTSMDERAALAWAQFNTQRNGG